MQASLLRQSVENRQHPPSSLLEDFREYLGFETDNTFIGMIGYLKPSGSMLP